MNLRWLLFDYADPALPLSFWKRQKLFWGIYPVWNLPKPLRRGALARRYLMLAPLFIPPFFFFSQIPPSNVLLIMIPYFVLCWLWVCIIYGLYSLPEHYYRIRLEGYDVCLGCGYWLRGLDETIRACPECGEQRKPLVDSNRDISK